MQSQNKKQIFTQASSVAVVIIAVKLVGFVRQMTTAAAFGAGADTDLINLAQNILGDFDYLLSQVISAAFISSYIYAKERSESAGKQFFANAVKVFALIGTVFMLFILLAAPVLTKVIAPSYGQEQHRELVFLVRLHAPCLIPVVLTGFFCAALSANEKFALAESRGALNSLIVIVGIALFSRRFGISVLVALYFVSAWGLFLFFGGTANCYRHGVKADSLKEIAGSPDIRRMLMISAPLLLSIAANVINEWVGRMLLSGLIVGAVTAVGYAASLYQLITTIIGGFCTIFFTHVTNAVSQGHHERAGKLTEFTLKAMVTMFLPISILTVLCAKDIVTIVYGRGAFGEQAIYMTAEALRGYGFLFVAVALREVLNKILYGYQDTKRPMINNLIGIGVGIVLSVILCRHFGIFGVALGSSAGVFVSGLLNGASAKKHYRMVDFGSLKHCMPAWIIGGAACALTANYLTQRYLMNASSLVRFVGASIGGMAVYLVIMLPSILRLIKEK